MPSHPQPTACLFTSALVGVRADKRLSGSQVRLLVKTGRALREEYKATPIEIKMLACSYFISFWGLLATPPTQTSYRNVDGLARVWKALSQHLRQPGTRRGKVPPVQARGRRMEPPARPLSHYRPDRQDEDEDGGRMGNEGDD